MSYVGQTVHYVPTFRDECIAAIITLLHKDGRINLVSFLPTGMRYYHGVEHDKWMETGDRFHHLRECAHIYEGDLEPYDG